jgi:hypothetical protein
LLLVSIAVSLGSVEGLVRLIFGHRMVLFPRFHSKAVYGGYTLRRLRPNTQFWHTSVDGRWKFVIDAQGFRNDRDFPYARTPGRLRVLAIGDSETEGFEVRQDFTYSAVVERWLQSRGVEAEAIAFLENEGVKYEPEVVIYGLFGNDYLDNVRSGLFSLDQGSLVATNQVYAPAVAILDVIDALPPLRWLSQHSYGYNLAFNTVWDRYKTLSVTAAQKELVTEYATAVTTPDDYEASLMAALLKRLGRFCRERGILLIILDIPAAKGDGIGEFQTSILPSVRNVAQESADVVLLSDDVLGAYRGAAELHVPHGQRHINEFSHTIFGVRAGEAILKAQRACGISDGRLALCRVSGAHLAGTK